MDVNTDKLSCREPDQSAPDVEAKTRVNNWFVSMASFWDRIYEERTLDGCIYQDRKATALQWIKQLALPYTARLLEVGCGAGVSTAALAVRGYHITAVDSVTAMIDLTRKRVVESGSAQRVSTVCADARELPMSDDCFDLVFALGVLPWMDDPQATVRELARVTRPGGYVLVTVDNSLHLDEIVDPRRNPILKPVRRRLAPILRAVKLLGPASLPEQSPLFKRHSRSACDSMLLEAGLKKLQGLTVGFGPFTFFGKHVLPDSIGIKVHRMLQAAANRNLPIIVSYGMQYLVMATKRA